ncbi:TlpA family protein disulfide reductase [Psychroserpens luteolus]|uniref:TlpA family protein disulfide reductase n=1 Tax=Psychroserpens luteolus TaxID=2855840 RepID=UPI001E598DCD|nr:TlpA disulfide reductase family protein [Psychroserpens luteolus]MCD2258935.1 TlpA family protein disulfide reductase [Psychroserpens luteolus]
MKKFLILALFSLIIASCQSEPKKKLSDLNLYFESDIEIDSVFISNIAQDREFQFLPFSNVMNIDLNDSINDLYNINFYTKNGLIMNQMWLDGQQLQIKGRISKKIEIDTVIGSSLYYKAKDFSKRYKKMSSNSSEISTSENEFLLQELDAHIENPFSIHVASQFLMKNMQNKDELQKAYAILNRQPKQIKNHLYNDFKKIENLLTVNAIDISNYKFLNTNNELSDITFSEGKIHLIDFWFVDCKPCVKDHKYISKQLDKLKANNIELIGVSIDRDHSKWMNYLDSNSYNWANFRDVDNYDDRLTKNMYISTFPTYMLVDDQGNIIKNTNNYKDIEEQLK